MSLKDEFKKGVTVNLIARYSNIVIQILIGSMLARLISPEEFGVVAIIMVFITFFNLLSDMGIGPALIQNRELTSEDNRVIFNFTIILGALMGISFYNFSYLISSFYSNDIYIPIGKYLSISVFFYSLNIVPQALLRRERQFKALGIIEISCNIIAGLITIYLAYAGFSYYSLVWQSNIRALLMFILLFKLSNLKMEVTFNINPIKKIFKFSAYQFLFNFINYFSRNLDNILVGKFIGAGALGYYDKAYKLMLYPVQNLTFVITPVLHPVLAKHQDDKEIIYSAYSKLIRILALAGIPISVVLFFTADEIISIMYGSSWLSSVPVFKVLAITVWIQIILSSSGTIFQATGRTDLLFFSGSLSAIVMVSGIIGGIFFKGNIVWVGLGLLVAFSINFIQCYWIMYKFIFNRSLIELFSLIKSAILIGLIMIMGFIIIRTNFTNSLISLVTKMTIGLTFFLIGLIAIREPLFNSLISKVARKRKEQP